MLTYVTSSSSATRNFAGVLNTTQIPAQVAGLDQLEVIHFGHNQLTGSIPVELAGLSKLRNLGSCMLKDAAANATTERNQFDCYAANLQGKCLDEARAASVPTCASTSVGGTATATATTSVSPPPQPTGVTDPFPILMIAIGAACAFAVIAAAAGLAVVWKRRSARTTQADDKQSKDDSKQGSSGPDTSDTALRVPRAVRSGTLYLPPAPLNDATAAAGLASAATLVSAEEGADVDRESLYLPAGSVVARR
ncbi:hypothetical protein H9P43_008686 [Blastocladiella emersonii ATCC 22665]|nr:hypothetical protein H9P43_008686 [Blastocladiella emersonii ATCC 22665]